MTSYREYLTKMLHTKNTNVKVEGFRRAVADAAERGDRIRILKLRKLHEYNGDAYPEDDECLKIADAALTTIGSVELRKAVEDEKVLDALFEMPAQDFLTFFKSLTLEQKKALNEKLAQRVEQQ